MTSTELLQQVDVLLGKKDDHKLKSLLTKLNFHDIARVIDHLSHGKRKTFALLPPEIQAEVALVIAERSKHIVFPRLSDHTIARFLHFNDEDDAADILHYLEEDKRSLVLGNLKDEKRTKVEKLLKFGPETAGGLMDLNFIVVKPEFTLKDVADKVKLHMDMLKQAPLVAVADVHGKTIGYVPYRTLILATPSKPVSALLHSLPVISYKTDQEKVVKLATKERADVIGVVDEHDQLLGIIHLKDLLKIAQQEATEDVYRFAGVSTEEEMLDSAPVAIRLRYAWLIINLATAFLAAFVVSLFSHTIERLPLLAAYMPIVAGMGGNAGTQSLAVVVRGLAIDGNARKYATRVILKEAIAGCVNGVINGVIVAVVVYVVKGSAPIALILLASMVINLIVAGIFGALVPFSLKAMKIDPAIASTVFVTTATDVFGFLAFLGLATIFLH